MEFCESCRWARALTRVRYVVWCNKWGIPIDCHCHGCDDWEERKIEIMEVDLERKDMDECDDRPRQTEGTD
jgi:hypothetical protein